MSSGTPALRKPSRRRSANSPVTGEFCVTQVSESRAGGEAAYPAPPPPRSDLPPSPAPPSESKCPGTMFGTFLDRVRAQVTHSDNARRQNGRPPARARHGCPHSDRAGSAAARARRCRRLLGAPLALASDRRETGMSQSEVWVQLQRAAEGALGFAACARNRKRTIRAPDAPRGRGRRARVRIRASALISGTIVLEVARPNRAAQQRPGQEAMRSSVAGRDRDGAAA